MVDDDVLLIRKILLGDDTAFSTLVEKYRKGVHAFAWRKIGDFHHAEEITQDAFIQVYKNLSTLRNPNQFAGWLYVIANRLCIKWKEKRKITTQSLEGTSMSEINASSYTKYISEQRDREATEKRLEIVNKLLKKLPESERTVITLYYLGEMTAKEIGKFLGVSINTIKSRLRRARERLKEEEAMIRENINCVQFPTQTTANIMKEISQLKPTAPSGNNPLVPIGISAASALIVLLLMGVGMQYLVHFQKPYTLEATSEPTIKIVDAQLVLESPVETAVRNQVGRSDAIGRNSGKGQQPDTPLFAAAQADDRVKSDAKSEWTQTKGPEGGAIGTLFTTTRGDVYAGTLNGLYRFSDDEQAWTLINTIKGPPLPLYDGGWWWPVAESQSADILYLATDIAILESFDRGETWETLCKGTNINRDTDVYAVHPVGLVIADNAVDITIYLAYRNGVFRTDDVGKTWTPLLAGLENTKIRTIAAIQDTVFAGTYKGLYRLNNNVWEQVLIDPENVQNKTLYIAALVVSENNLYVAAKQVEKSRSTGIGIDIALDTLDINLELAPFKQKQTTWSLYHTNDMGDSWHVITPKLDTADNKDNYIRDHLSALYRTVVIESPSIHLAASGEKIMVVVGKYHFYSINGGKTWTHLDDISNADHVSGVVLLNDNTVYRSGLSGIHRTTDCGASWHKSDTGIINTFIHQLIYMNNTLYANIGPLRVLSSTDSGDSWTPVAGDTHKYASLVEYDGALYATNESYSALRVFRFSHDENRFIEIPDVPVIGEKKPPNPNKVVVETVTFGEEEKRPIDRPLNPDDLADINPRNKGLTSTDHNIDINVFHVLPFGSFAASRTAYYVEYEHKLFRWKPDTTEWYDTGLVDTGQIDTNFENPGNNGFVNNFKLAVSKNTVYVGMRDGRLMRSFDEGDTWKHAAADLPFHVENYKQIIFVGQTVYVATDRGVALSINGTDWQAIMDTQGEILVVDMFAVDRSKVYGLSGQKVYLLSEHSGTWQQVTPEITHSISTFEVDGDTVYVGTQGKGVFRFTLDDSGNGK